MQNAVFASFPSRVSRRVLHPGHFLIVSLWLSRSGIGEAFIFIGKRDYKFTAGRRERGIFPLKVSARVAAAEAGCQHWGHEPGGVPGATPLGADWVPAAGGTSEMRAVNRPQPLSGQGLSQEPDGEENPKEAPGSSAGCGHFSSLTVSAALAPLPDLSSCSEHVQPQTRRGATAQDSGTAAILSSLRLPVFSWAPRGAWGRVSGQHPGVGGSTAWCDSAPGTC